MSNSIMYFYQISEAIALKHFLFRHMWPTRDTTLTYDRHVVELFFLDVTFTAHSSFTPHRPTVILS